MFKSIKVIYHGGEKKLGFELEDSEFGSCVLAYKIECNTRASMVFREYQRRNLDVVKNLVLFYRWSWGLSKLAVLEIDRDKEYIDQEYPDLQYGTKYYPCVRRQYKRLHLF